MKKSYARGLLALIIIAIAVSIYVLRRSHTFQPPTDPEDED